MYSYGIKVNHFKILAQVDNYNATYCASFKSCSGCATTWTCNWCEAEGRCVEGIIILLRTYCKKIN